uniref:Large ribosomal subunit protein bL32c n=1 Tax=Polysiphonia elongata TaxID=159753 RepID=A0A1Z1MB96_9FLOR|nr:ribosomal protein L32 [Polysiphonia elongata]ARW63239.1 ribosomal protein L32 [Polysiphonia elongata]
MAVPKKRTSKSKSKSRKSIWMNKALFASNKALSLAKSLMTGKSTSFIYSKSLDDYK